MHLGKLGRGLAAMTVIVMLSAACTPDPEVPPTPSPSIPATPVETEQERQERVAYEAAEKSYREFRVEYGRVMEAGGASKPTRLMEQTAGGSYLKEIMEVVEAYKGFGDHKEGTETIVYVRPAGYSPKSVLLDVCEDSRKVKSLDKNGKSTGVGELRTIRIDVQLKGSQWKLWSGEGAKVEKCE